MENHLAGCSFESLFVMTSMYRGNDRPCQEAEREKKGGEFSDHENYPRVKVMEMLTRIFIMAEE